MNTMMEKASAHDQVIQALPAVSEAVRAEIARQVAAGEPIACSDGDHIIASRPASRDLAARWRELMEECERQAASKAKSAA